MQVALCSSDGLHKPICILFPIVYLACKQFLGCGIFSIFSVFVVVFAVKDAQPAL